MTEPKIIIHGGFFSESTDQNMKEAKAAALKDIVSQARAYLENHSAVETVVFAVSLLEDNPLFNAGLGSQIQADGKIRLSASLMDGYRHCFSGVINIQDVQNPVRIAHILQEQDDRVLSGNEALDFARKNGFPPFNPETTARKKEFEEKVSGKKGLGTVGCVALDAGGRLAAATSTGGKGFEMPGRVSDSATVAGNFANRMAAVSCTGVGEDIVNAGIAAKIVTRVTDGLSLAEANRKTFAELRELEGFAGAISITAAGEVFHTDSHPFMV
ncbi:MAG TPA: isoaspartyl peptidase/L-asparaginase, partial [Sphingobacteriaceae bacterium]